MVSFECESGCCAFHCLYRPLTVLGLRSQTIEPYSKIDPTRVLFDVDLALSVSVLRLRSRNLGVLVAVLTVFPICSCQSSLLSMVTPKYLIL